MLQHAITYLPSPSPFALNNVAELNFRTKSITCNISALKHKEDSYGMGHFSDLARGKEDSYWKPGGFE